MTITRAKWFPAQVRLPGGQELRKAYVVLAEGGDNGGITVYSRPDVVAYHADIDWAGTPELPRTQRAARNGVSVRLLTGEVIVITPGVGCRCGALGRWAGPAFATTVSTH